MILKGGGKSLNAEGEGVGQLSLSMTSQAINKIFFPRVNNSKFRNS